MKNYLIIFSGTLCSGIQNEQIDLKNIEKFELRPGVFYYGYYPVDHLSGFHFRNINMALQIIASLPRKTRNTFKRTDDRNHMRRRPDMQSSEFDPLSNLDTTGKCDCEQMLFEN